MKKRLSCAALSAAAAAVIVTGCLWAADEPEADAPEEEQIVLHVMHNKQEAPETYHKLAEAFHQKYPDITVEYEVPTDFDLELQKRMNRGETPDIYTASPVQANAGLLLDLSGQEFLSRMRPVHYDTVTRPGEYFFPMDIPEPASSAMRPCSPDTGWNSADTERSGGYTRYPLPEQCLYVRTRLQRSVDGPLLFPPRLLCRLCRPAGLEQSPL